MNVQSLLITALLCIVVGFVAGAMVAMLWNEKERKTARHETVEEPDGVNREVARLWRDPTNGRLFTEVDGRLLASSQVLNEEQRRTLRQAAKDWSEWLGVAPEAKPAAPAVPAQTQAPLPAAVRAVPIPAAAVDSAKPAATSMVGQIDEILQEMLPNSALAARTIRLAEEPRHAGVIVWVDRDRFEGIDAVTNPEAKALIRSAVSEWERRSELNSRGM